MIEFSLRDLFPANQYMAVVVEPERIESRNYDMVGAYCGGNWVFGGAQITISTSEAGPQDEIVFDLREAIPGLLSDENMGTIDSGYEAVALWDTLATELEAIAKDLRLRSANLQKRWAEDEASEIE